MYDNNIIIYNSIIYSTSPSISSKHNHLPPAQNINTQIKLHHSRHPSDNLCGVRYLGWEDGRRIEEKEIDWKRRRYMIEYK